MNKNEMLIIEVLIIISILILPVTVAVNDNLISENCCLSRWVEKQKLTANDADWWDAFGESVSIYGDYAFIGSPHDDTATGSVYVFKRTSDSWMQQRKLTASDAARDHRFGNSVSAYGNSVLVGSTGSNDFIGSAYVFRRYGNLWIEEAILTPSDGEIYDSFGQSVSLFKDYALIGAPYNNNQNGSVYVFKRDGTIWTEEDKLSVNATNNTFGETFGNSVSIYGDYALIGASLNEYTIGSAYIFKRNGSSWEEMQKLMPSDGATYDWFGYSVSIYGDYALIGAHNAGYGSAYVFKRIDNNWIEEEKLEAEDGTEGDWLGYSVSLYNNYALLGAPFRDEGEGVAYIFKRYGTTWREDAILNASDGIPYINFGYSVSLYGNTALLGAPDAYWGKGSAYIFKREIQPSLYAHPCE
jgi:hypothetical protein